MNIFRKIFVEPFVKIGKFFKFAFSDRGRQIIADRIEQIQAVFEKALAVVKMIDQIAPNRTVEEVMILVDKYGLHTVTPELLRDPVMLEKTLHAAALKALQHISDAPDSILDAAIVAAINALKAQAQADAEAESNFVR